MIELALVLILAVAAYSAARFARRKSRTKQPAVPIIRDAYHDRAIKRFWPKVDRVGRGPCDCWPWIAGISGNGYPGFRYRGKSISSHLFIYRVLKGEPKPGHVVMHTCHNRLCVNPGHLEEGKQSRNMKDTRDVGRGNAKLSADDRARIRDLRALGSTYASLASEYGVNPRTIKRVCVGRKKQ